MESFPEFFNIPYEDAKLQQQMVDFFIGVSTIVDESISDGKAQVDAAIQDKGSIPRATENALINEAKSRSELPIIAAIEAASAVLGIGKTAFSVYPQDTDKTVVKGQNLPSGNTGVMLAV